MSSNEEYGTDYAATYDETTADLYEDRSDLATADGLENLYQAIQNRLLTPMGSLPLHPTYGSRLYTLIGKGSSVVNEMLVKMMVVEALQYEERIALIQNIDVSFTRNTQTIGITVEIVSVYSTQLTTNTEIGG